MASVSLHPSLPFDTDALTQYLQPALEHHKLSNPRKEEGGAHHILKAPLRVFGGVSWTLRPSSSFDPLTHSLQLAIEQSRPTLRGSEVPADLTHYRTPHLTSWRIVRQAPGKWSARIDQLDRCRAHTSAVVHLQRLRSGRHSFRMLALWQVSNELRLRFESRNYSVRMVAGVCSCTEGRGQLEAILLFLLKSSMRGVTVWRSRPYRLRNLHLRRQLFLRCGSKMSAETTLYSSFFIEYGWCSYTLGYSRHIF